MTMLSRRRRFLILLLLLGFLGAVVQPARADPSGPSAGPAAGYILEESVLDGGTGGGTLMTGGGLMLQGSLGQPSPNGLFTGIGIQVELGFWQPSDAQRPVYLPVLLKR
jgi:hypothetical protein